MEIRLFVGLAAVAAGFACAFAASRIALASLRRRRVALSAQEGGFTAEGLVAWRLRNGYAPLVPLARRLLKLRRVADLAETAARLCAGRGMSATSESLVTVGLAALATSSLLAGLLAGSAIAAGATACCTSAVAAGLLANARDKRQDAVRDAVPDAIESMSVCFGSGFTLLQTFHQVAEDVPGPLGRTFARSAHMLEMGSSAESALAELRDGSRASELAFVAVALDVQHQSGGAMRQVLDAAADAVKGEVALRRSLRVQTAQAKLSARVVSIMPFILIAAFSLASPDFLAPFFSSPFGYALLGLAVAMQASGILLVRRALTVEGVS